MALADKARGQRIAQMRKRKHLTQQALAERLGIGYRTVQTWESGTMPEWPNLERLAKALGTRPEELIGDEDAMPEPGQLDRLEQKLDALLVAVDELAARLPEDWTRVAIDEGRGATAAAIESAGADAVQPDVQPTRDEGDATPEAPESPARETRRSAEGGAG